MLLTLAKILSRTLKSLVAYLDTRITTLSEKQRDAIVDNEKNAEMAIEGIVRAKVVHANKCADAITKLEIQRSELKALA